MLSVGFTWRCVLSILEKKEKEKKNQAQMLLSEHGNTDGPKNSDTMFLKYRPSLLHLCIPFSLTFRRVLLCLGWGESH